jgi:hypothetical protein
MIDNIYTRISSSALVAVNPHKYVPTNSDSVMHKYAAEYRDTSVGKEALPPHISISESHILPHAKNIAGSICPFEVRFVALDFWVYY